MAVILRLKGSDDIQVDESQVEHFRKIGYHAVRRPSPDEASGEPAVAPVQATPKPRKAPVKKAAPTTTTTTAIAEP